MPLMGNIRKSYSEMSALSIHIPHAEGPSSEQAAPPAPENVLTANELSGYRVSMALECAIGKWPAPISENTRTRISMSQDLSLYSNSDYFYAISPIAIDFSAIKGVAKLPILNHRLRASQF